MDSATNPGLGSADRVPSLSPRTSRLAIASLILGILGFLLLPAVAGILCGVIAMIQISRSAGALKGMGLAIAGSVVSCVMLAVLPVIAILAAILLPALAKAKSQAQFIHGMNNVRQLTLAMHLYADDYQGVLPAATNWCDVLIPMLGGNTAAFRRPDENEPMGENFSSYGFNANLAGAKVAEINPKTVMVFELNSGGWNIAGGPGLLRRPARPGEKITIGFVDGHTEGLGAGTPVENLRWEP